MRKLLALLLCTALLLTFAACSNSNTEIHPTETTEEAKIVDTYPYPTINNKLTWDAINAIPMKRSDMTIQEMRELCVQFMRFSKTAMWTPNDTVDFIRNSKGTEDQIVKGGIYAGLPYVGLGTGNVYRMMDHLNEETGVMDMELLRTMPKLFGNQCSCTTFWGWGRVVNSMGIAYTANMTQGNGYLRVGPYTYPDNTLRFSEQYTTEKVCQDNGLDIMCQSYAQLHLGDGLVYYTTAGHAIMASSEPHVEYTGNKINPTTSYITILEQSQRWEEYTNDAGDTAQVKNSIDKKMTFLDLFNNAYIPFTYAEFLGTKGVDETKCEINLSGDSVEANKLFSAKVTANFGISDIYVSLKKADGKEVYRLAVYADTPNERTLNISRAGNTFAWGDYNKLSGEYSVEVSVQLSTGERPVVYSGKVTIEN